MQGVPVVELPFPCAGAMTWWRNQESKGARETKFSKNCGKQVFLYYLAVTVLDFSSETVVRIPPLVKNTATIRLPKDFDFRTRTRL